MHISYSRSVRMWLLTGVIMVFLQIVIGGITRLTESGLSITKWEVVKGTLPPLSEEAWNTAFELYKSTPQYREINEGMALSDFKFIYFWEYIHRFWARMMGFVFLLPFIYFLAKKKLDKPLLIKLGLVVLLAALAATFGWIMVASGLIDRPWVNAYKLSLHLMIALAVFSVLFYTYLSSLNWHGFRNKGGFPYRVMWTFAALLVIQIFLGGVMSGMKAAVVFPTWPDIRGEYLPAVLLDALQWNADNFNKYDSNIFMPSLIHFLHRTTGYIAFVLGMYFCLSLYKIIRSDSEAKIQLGLIYITFASLMLQVTLGIITVLTSGTGKVSVLWGVLHQAVAILLLATVVFSIFIHRIGYK